MDFSNAPQVTNNVFTNATIHLTTVGDVTFAPNLSQASLFYNQQALVTVGNLDFSACTSTTYNAQNVLRRCQALQNVGGMTGLRTTTYITSPVLTDRSLYNIIFSLGNAANTNTYLYLNTSVYDRVRNNPSYVTDIWYAYPEPDPITGAEGRYISYGDLLGELSNRGWKIGSANN